MCLGIPGRIVTVAAGEGPRLGTVDFGGVSREVCLDFVPEATVGDHVLVHVGFAIARIDEEDALATLALLRALDAGVGETA